MEVRWGWDTLSDSFARNSTYAAWTSPSPILPMVEMIFYSYSGVLAMVVSILGDTG